MSEAEMPWICGIASGAELLETPRNILNLWTQTEEAHLGHLHMINTAKRLVACGHDVTFYVGEFQSDLWPAQEFRRREESYRIQSEILKALASGAKAEFGYRAPDPSVERRDRARYGKIFLGVRTDSLEKPLEDDIKDDLKRVFRKQWGGQNSPFAALFSLYAKERGFNTLLIAERHAYIGRTLAWFAKEFQRVDIQVIVVRDVQTLDGRPMSSGVSPIRMQEPTQYLQRSLELEDDAAKRLAFIRQFCELFLEDQQKPADFATWWNQNADAMDVPPFTGLVSKADDLFEHYRTTVYGVLPGTRDETSQRINNQILLEYTGLVVKRWRRESSPPAWARDVDEAVNDEPDAFEGTYYDEAFAAVTSELQRFENPVLGLPRPVVDSLLRLASQNRTTDLFLFFGAKKTHRDHYVHTFNVAALGQFLLDLRVSKGDQLKEYIARNLGCDPRDVEMTWWLTAMLHDHAYPLFSMMQWLVRLAPLAQAYPDKRETLADLARPHLENLPLIHSDIKEPMLQALEEQDFGISRLWDATRDKRRALFWFLLPQDLDELVAQPPVDHAFAAVLNIVCHLQDAGSDVRNKELIRQLLRGILFHTQVKLAEGKVSAIHWRTDPLAYLLLICDELQEWSRRALREREGVMRATNSELLLAPLRRRLETEEGWQLPAESVLDVTVRYFDINDLKGWDSHAFHAAKKEMFERLRTEQGDDIPPVRLQYALATPEFPARQAPDRGHA